MKNVMMVAPYHADMPPEKSGGTEMFIWQLYCALEDDIKIQLISRKLAENVPDDWNSAYELNYLSLLVDTVNDFDILHVHSPAAVAMFVHERDTKPIVCTVHHPYNHGFKELYQSNITTHYVFPSESCMVDNRLAAGYHQHVIPHGIDFGLYSLADKKQDYYCFMGRILKEKGILEAITMCALLKVHLKIAGKFYSTGLQEVVMNLLDEFDFEYVGELNFEEKVKFLGESRGLLFPINWEEPFGLVMIEAMACGTPVFALNRGSVSELVLNHETGYVASSLSNMEAAVKELTQWDAASIRSIAKKYCDMKICAGRYMELYSQIL